LARAKSDGFVENLKPLLKELSDNGIWLSEKLKNEILKKVGEN
jgi:predicted nucleic acid-binding protein